MSKQTFQIASQRVANYLLGRGFSYLHHQGVNPTKQVFQAPGKWSTEKTRWIVKRAKQNPGLGLPAWMKPAVEPKVVARPVEPTVDLERAFEMLGGGGVARPVAIQIEKARVHAERPTKASWLGLDNLAWLDPPAATVQNWRRAMM